MKGVGQFPGSLTASERFKFILVRLNCCEFKRDLVSAVDVMYFHSTTVCQALFAARLCYLHIRSKHSGEGKRVVCCIAQFVLILFCRGSISTLMAWGGHI